MNEFISPDTPRTRSRYLGLIAGLLCILPVSAPGSEPGVVDGTFVVPHVAWAKPLAGGAIKTLAIVPVNGARNLWDLADALELDLTVLKVNDAAGAFGSQRVFGMSTVRFSGIRMEDNLARARTLLAQDYELIVLANVAMSSLPPEIAYQISRQVVNGAGLVMTNAQIGDPMLESLYTRRRVGDDALDLLGSLPVDGLDAGVAWTEDQIPVSVLGAVKPYPLRRLFRAYRAGQGRFISLPFPFDGVSWGAYASVPALIPGIRVNMANRWQEDYHYALVAKACLWAASRNADARIASILPQGGTPGAGQRPEVEVVVEGRNGFSGSLRYELRDAITHQVVANGQHEVRLASKPHLLRFTPDAVPLAKTFINVRLLDAQGAVVDFGAGFVMPRAVPAEFSITLDEDAVEAGQPVGGRVHVPAEWGEATLRLELFDSRGRIWEREQLDAGTEGEARFALRSDRSPLIVHGLRAVAVTNGVLLASQDIFFTIRRPRPAYYVSISDEAWPTWNTLRRLERVYEWGADGLRDHKSGGIGMARQPDVNPVNQAIVNAMAGLDHNPGRPHIGAGLPFDKAFIAQIEKTATENSRRYRAFNQRLYNTTDDCGPNLDRLLPDSWPLFLDNLKMRHGDIQRLNAEWGTSFDGFDAIPQARVAEARKSGDVAIWSDYQRFAGEAYLDTQRRYRDAIRAIDPEAASGCDAVYYGTSLARLYRELSYIMPYYRPWLVHFGRSLARGENPVYTGICSGVYAYYNGAETLNRRMPWHVLLAGNNAFLFWSLLVGFTDDLSKGDDQLIGWMMDEVSRIKHSGAAEWLLSATREPAEAFIYYGEDSRRVETTAGAVFSTVEEACTAFQEMLEDQGVPYNYIAAESILEDRVLESPGVRLLVLPSAVALSASEAEAISRFVASGGTVWADTRPGMRNEHGRKLPEGLLDDLFGVVSSGDPELREVRLAFTNQPPVLARADASLRTVRGTPALHADAIPTFIRNRHGSGEAVLFNLDPAFYGAERGVGSDAERGTLGRRLQPALASHAWLASLVADAGLAPRQPTLDGDSAVGLTLTDYHREGGRLLALEVKPVDGITYPATVKLPLERQVHVHELRTGRNWTATDQLTLTVSPNDVFVFSLFEKPSGKLSVDAPHTIQPGDTLQIRSRTEGGPPSTLLTHTLVAPDGRISRDYIRHALSRNGEAFAVIHLPWNAESGSWTLETLNLLTGDRVSHSVQIKEVR